MRLINWDARSLDDSSPARGLRLFNHFNAVEIGTILLSCRCSFPFDSP